MHENLKYTIRLNKNTKPFKDFSSRINSLNDKDAKSEISDWQSILSGNDYNSLYLVYGKFIGTDVKDGFHLKKLQIYLQNYSGSISLGLNGYARLEYAGEVKKDENDPERDPRFPESKRYVLTIGLQGNKFDNVVRDVKIKSRNDDGGFIIKEGDLLLVKTLFTPVDSTLTNIFDIQKINDARFVDEKFMERIGEDVYITPEGERSLITLNDLKIISDHQLEQAGIDRKDPKFKRNMISLKESKKLDLERKGKDYPCIPRTSKFYII